jgi:hypothetical protein
VNSLALEGLPVVVAAVVAYVVGRSFLDFEEAAQVGNTSAGPVDFGLVAAFVVVDVVVVAAVAAVAVAAAAVAVAAVAAAAAGIVAVVARVPLLPVDFVVASEKAAEVAH